MCCVTLEGPHLLPKPNEKTTIKSCDAVKWQQQSRNHAAVIKAKRANKSKNKDTTRQHKGKALGTTALESNVFTFFSAFASFGM